MAHVKAGSSRANQKANVVGKRRGIKANHGQLVNGGQILVRQTGIVYKAGMNTKVARDSSIISKIAGVVSFSYIRRPNGLKTVVNVLPKKVEKKVAKKKIVKKVEAKKNTPVKKVVKEKTVSKKTIKEAKK